MSIKYQIIKTRLANQVKYVGRVSPNASFDKPRLVQRMLEMGTSLSKEDINAVLSLFETAVSRICIEGNRINLGGFIQFTPTISGIFDGQLDGFSSDRNRVYLTAQVSKIFNKRFEKNAAVEKDRVIQREPFLHSIEDLASETVNDAVTVGDIVTIYGERLKFNRANNGEYLRFVKGDQSAYVELTRLKKCSDRELVFLMPPVGFKKGYFEVANSLNTQTVRFGRSAEVQVID